MRLMMVTGKLQNGEDISPKLRMPLLILNKYIEASLIGTNTTGASLAILMDTNTVIRKIARGLGSVDRKKYNIPTIGVKANPFTFYYGLIRYLNSNPLTLTKLTLSVSETTETLTETIVRQIKANKREEYLGPTGILDFFILERYNHTHTLNSWMVPQQIIIPYENETHTYKLDSAVLRDTNHKHFSAYITCHGKQFGFDGESFSRMSPFNWREKLNADVKWRFAEQHEIFFNFQKGYIMLFYYRDD